MSLAAGFFVPVLALAATAGVLGRGATRLLGLSFTGRVERWSVSAALGLAVASHLLLALGLLGLLRPLPVLLAAAGVHALGAGAWRELWTDLRGGGVSRRRWAAVMLGLSPLVLLALYPPTAFDATLYHLPYARAFAESGGVPFLADRRVPVFPQANEILFAAVLLFGRDVAAHGVQVLATLLTACLLVAWGRRAWPAWRVAGWCAAAVFLGNPIVVYLAATAYIEAGLALFTTLSLFALDLWRRGGGKGWLAIAAIAGATAADVKYLGLFFLGIAGLTVLLAAVRSRTTVARWRETLLFGAVAAVFLVPWYLRIIAHTGNPLFPFLPEIFGHSAWDPEPGTPPEESLLSRLARWARLPWDVVFARERYGLQPPVSPVYLATLPLLARAALRDAGARRLLLIAIAYSLTFLWLPTDSRYLVPILPLVSLVVAGALAETLQKWPRLAGRPVAAAVCLACLSPGLLYAGYRMARQGPLPLTPEARHAYLARRLPAYAAIAWLNRERGSGYTLWAWHAENLTYFAKGRFLGDFMGPASYSRVQARSPDPASLHRELRRLGVTHLLLPYRGALGQAIVPPVPEDAAFRLWFTPVYQDPHARLYALRPVGAAGRSSASRSRR